MVAGILRIEAAIGYQLSCWLRRAILVDFQSDVCASPDIGVSICLCLR